ncbi:MAG: Tol-Pal system beta propeller repeat protein TolB [Hyphomicrobiaceae bacterium]
MLGPVGLASTARAQLDVDVTQGNVDPLRIAIPYFIGESDVGAQMADVIANNLSSSGLFAALDRGAFIDRPASVNKPPRFADWRTIDAQALVVGGVSPTGDGRIKVEFRLWDVASGKQLAGQSYSTNPDNWRRIAHVISDTIYERMTGEKGYFDTRVVFVDETGPKDARVKRLAVMDQDGFNLRTLTAGQTLVLTPRFSPSSQMITYTSFEQGTPHVFLQNLDTGQKELVGNFPNMAFAPRFSPDGGRIVMSLGSPEGWVNLFEMDLASRQLRQLTGTRAIDTGPCFSPDGTRIVFESDRDGSQQLYVMSAGGGQAQRISFSEGRYATPVWSPRGDLIAFTKQLDGRFLIGVMKPDGSGERILTDGYHNEGPTWAPNGRLLMFFRESQGASGGPRLFTIDLTGYNERQVPTPNFASDPAWSPPLN